MTERNLLRVPTRGRDGLDLAASAWFLVAALGQWAFVTYLLAVYGLPAFQGQWQSWNAVFPRGHVPGDTLNNGVVALHLLPALLIMGGGPLLLVPALRTRYPAHHRWLGRIYGGGAAAASLAGLYLVWVRGGTFGDRTQHLGITLDALLILISTVQTVRHARARRWDLHRRWALRLFLATSAVWFFRIGLAGWIALHGRPVGFDPRTFSGPFLSVLTFAQTLVPWALLEAYLNAPRLNHTLARGALIGTLALATLATAYGSWAATRQLWAPFIVRAFQAS